MFQVIKRDGSKADFTLTKINDAIMKAFTATQMSYNNDIIGDAGTTGNRRFPEKGGK